MTTDKASRFIVNVEAIILGKDGRYLMIVRGDGESHAPGTLSVPGGKVDDTGSRDSILEATLHREVMEEVGVQIEQKMLYVQSSSFITDDGISVVDVVFLCKHKAGQPRQVAIDEVTAIEWMSINEILSHPKLPPWTRRSLMNAEQVRLNHAW